MITKAFLANYNNLFWDYYRHLSRTNRSIRRSVVALLPKAYSNDSRQRCRARVARRACLAHRFANGGCMKLLGKDMAFVYPNTIQVCTIISTKISSVSGRVVREAMWIDDKFNLSLALRRVSPVLCRNNWEKGTYCGAVMDTNMV